MRFSTRSSLRADSRSRASNADGEPGRGADERGPRSPARSPAWRRSRRAAAVWTRARTSFPSASSSTRCSPASARSGGATSVDLVSSMPRGAAAARRRPRVRTLLRRRDQRSPGFLLGSGASGPRDTVGVVARRRAVSRPEHRSSVGGGNVPGARRAAGKGRHRRDLTTARDSHGTRGVADGAEEAGLPERNWLEGREAGT